jgi:transposase-like protein
MTQSLHSQARTTHLIREEIRNSTLPQAELARIYNVTRQTIRKWQDRDSTEDGSHRPNKMYTTLTPEQECIVVELRKTLLLPTDDLLSVVREFINPAVSRAGLGRCLRRYGVSDLRDLVPETAPAIATKKSFKDYEPGYIHIDIKYLPQMPDEQQRRYLFVAIDRATRWVYMEIYADQTDSSSTDFLLKVTKACPAKIIKLLTDNGSQFTDRFTSKTKKQATGQHVFDRLCDKLGIEHRLIPPRHPQTNGMVERFNGRISEIVKQARFTSAAELESTLRSYLKIYNHNIPQRALNHRTPVQAMKEWQEKKPDLFIKRVYNQAGLDKKPHPKNSKIKMQAHHIISADGMKKSGLSEKIKSFGYDINKLHNLVFLPCTLQGACYLGIQPHRGNHDFAIDENSYDDDSEPRKYHDLVAEHIHNLNMAISLECKGDNSAMPHRVAEELENLSIYILKMIQHKPKNAPLTRIALSFLKGGVGCGGVDSVSNHSNSRHCPVDRNHLFDPSSPKKSQAEGQKIEKIEYVITSEYKLEVGK